MRIVTVGTALLLNCCATVTAQAPAWSYEIVAQHPHDPSAFTEGLALLGDKLLESTGRHGQSRMQVSDIATGRVLRARWLDAADFGEGATVAGGRIVQLTWKSGVGYLYDFELHPLASFRISGEGWGLAYDGRSLIRSDGSENLRFVDPQSLRDTRVLAVHDQGVPIRRLNELEAVNGLIYANVWYTDRIAVIAPADGHVVAWLDLSELRQHFTVGPDWDAQENVLNGIAYDPRSGHFYVTGKCWPVLFEIKVHDGGLSDPPAPSGNHYFHFR